MWLWIARLLLLASLFLIPVIETNAQNVSVLVGIRYEVPIPKTLPYFSGSADSLSRPAYRTLLITKNDASISLLERSTDLLIPGPNTLWRVGTKRSVYNNWVEDFVWSAPVSEEPVLPGIQTYNGEYCTGHRKQTIHYAGPEYLGLEQSSTGYCEDGAHPWFFNTFAFVPLDSSMHLGLPISRVLGSNARELMRTTTDRFLQSIKDENKRALYLSEPDEANWTLQHRQGRWSVVARLDAGGVADGQYADFTLDLPIPLRISGHAELFPSWTSVKSFSPDAVDAISSPHRDMIIILHPNSLTAHRIENGIIGPPKLSFLTGPGATVIMVRWATGRESELWSKYLSTSANQRTSGSM